MGLKHHTIILVPHTRARFRKWRVSSRQLIVVGGLGLALLVISIFSTWSFFSKTVDQHELAALAEENRQLRDVNKQFEVSIRELKTRLAAFEQRTRQLAIVAGLEETETSQQSGVGGGEVLVGEQPSDRASSALDGHLRRLTSRLDDVRAHLELNHRRTSATPAISPVRGILTSGFGYRADPINGLRSLHTAIDISTSPGQPVVATADGIVLRADRNGRLGNAVFVAHGFGYSTRYGHLADFNVEAGARVQRGDVIGYVGNTGRTTGYHLHYEVRVDGKPANPLVYILDSTPPRS